MLPRFPNAQKITDDAWQKAMFAAMHEILPLEIHPPVQPIIEGKSSDFQREDRQIRPLQLKKQQATTHFDTSSGKGATLELLYEKARELGESIAKQQWGMIQAAVDEAVAETGNTIKIKKGNITQEDIYRILETTEANFDEAGQPTQRLVCGPELAQELALREEQWRHDAAFHSKVAEITQRKRADFNEREARRRLVD
jgi:hypothetical protein